MGEGMMSKKRLGILLVVAAGLAAVAVYLFLFQPVLAQIDSLQTQLENEQKLIGILEDKKNQRQAAVENTKKLQQKVPVKPLMDQFLLDLQKAEVVSDSLIEKLTLEEEADNQETKDYLGGNVENQSPAKEPAARSSKPQGIEKFTFDITVTSPGYEEMNEFLQTIEGLERITKIEELEFQHQPQETVLEEATELTYRLKVSAYYFPQLEELAKDLPWREFPQPRRKDNPFYSQPEE